METYDLPLVQGETFERTFTWKINDVVQPLSGYTVKSQIRQKEDPSSALILDLSPYMAIVDDTIRLRVPGPIMAALDLRQFRRGTASWDLFLIETADPTNSERLLQGAATLDPAATETA